ncbi:MAG: hypothetical protein E6X23_20470 [Mixta calida]|uniref:tail fiber/spike domain-containing protein n=1 Tax=Mixta calida TaxID=665913 RepID=UPI002912CC6B|nr:hypothetical protein [Mixta calida]MDU4943880.1 hypothetical protein [Mixta calida]
MATQPTQNPVPSESPRDLKFNAGKIDEFVTSLAWRYTDRFGYQHYTIEGLRKLAFDAISGFGWILKESFEDGATLTLPNDALLWRSNGEYYRWSGALPKTVPAGSTPESTGGIGQGAWVGISDAALKTMLASSAGASMIGMGAGGTLEQIIHYVTPEQFGAIGDGTAHPLSESYTTLEAAQAVYPHVTSLSQTIDWAACQAADNYARGKSVVRCPWFAKYHFGDSNYLALGIESKWIGCDGTKWDYSLGQGTTMIRTTPSTTPAFGQDCVVRVMDATDAGSPDEAVRGIVFKGFHLSRGRAARRYPTRLTQSIGLHMNLAIKAEVDVSISGAEFGFFGYGCWGTTGFVRIDSCHKGYYVKPDEPTPERPVAGGTITALDLRLEIDATTFPISMSNTYYSKISGFFEGALATNTNYDSNNETAIGLDLKGCSGVMFEMGIEAFQGVHIYARNGNNCTVRFFPYGSSNDGYLTTTGVRTSDHTIKSISGGTPTTLPASSRAYYVNAGGNNIINFLDTYWYLDTVTPTDLNTHYLFHGDVLSSWNIIGGGVSGTPASSSYATVLPVRSDNLLRMIKVLGSRGATTYFAPSGYEYVSENLWRSTSYKSKAFTVGTPSTVTITAPANFKFQEVDVYTNLGATSAAAAAPPVLALRSDTSRTYVCSSSASALALNWKDYISVA